MKDLVFFFSLVLIFVHSSFVWFLYLVPCKNQYNVDIILVYYIQSLFTMKIMLHSSLILSILDTRRRPLLNVLWKTNSLSSSASFTSFPSLFFLSCWFPVQEIKTDLAQKCGAVLRTIEKEKKLIPLGL
jgi:hypothetical protein